MKVLISSLRMPRLLLSLSLVLWVGGAGCLIGCDSSAMAAMDEGAGVALHDNATVVASESCAKAVNHSCCAKHRGSSRHQQPAGQASRTTDLKASKLTTKPTSAFLLPTSERTMQTCPLAMNAGALVTKARSDESSTMTALSPVALPLIDTGRTVAHSLPPTWFSNRGHTYLRCCVFLI